jgi:hypothetical protein
MDTNEIRLLIGAVVFVLFVYRKRLGRLIIRTKAGSLDWQNVPPENKALSSQPFNSRSKQVLPADQTSIQPPAPPLEPPIFPAWLSRHRLKISISLALISLLMIALPFWWWHRHSEAWKLVLSDHLAESWALWKQGPQEPVHVVQSGQTLQGLTRLLDDYANMQGNDPHRVIELWVVDHYWQYWTTETFNDYVRANRRFVDSGGKIHRLFILTQDDLKNPLLTAVFTKQCENIGADIWRGDAAAIGNKAEYQIMAKAFQQLPYTETGFQSFDVLQLGDLTYYSSDFSPDYRAVGASTWFYGQTLDLKPLFNKSVAQRIDCSSWKTQVVENLQSQ